MPDHTRQGSEAGLESRLREGDHTPPVPTLADGSAAREPSLEPLLRARDLAVRLDLSANTVLDWFERGKLPGFKLGGAVRFSPSEIEAWLDAQHREAVR